MSMIGYLLLALAKILSLLVNMYTFIVAAAVIISWVRPDPYNSIVRILYQLTDPAFRLVRRIMPAGLMRTGIDFSPILVFFILILFDTVVVNILFDLARGLIAHN